MRLFIPVDLLVVAESLLEAARGQATLAIANDTTYPTTVYVAFPRLLLPATSLKAHEAPCAGGV